MNIFDSVPFFRYLVFFVIGILFQPIIEDLYSYWYGLGVGAFSLFAFLIFRTYKWSGALIVIQFVVLGLFLKSSSRRHQNNDLENADYLLIELNDDLKSGEVLAYRTDESWIDDVREQVLVHAKDVEIKGGDRFLAKSRVRLIEGNTNPHGFDFKTYYNKKGFQYRVFIQEGELFNHSDVVSIRKVFERRIERMYHQEVAYFLEALLLGDKMNLNPDLKEQFQAAGIMHVLAVSGLHVGIIFLCMKLILGVVLKSNKRRIRVLRSVILVTTIWGYVLLVGGMPSVVRAGIMLSMVIVGELLSKKLNYVNTLSFTALFILLFDVNMLYDVGFQLSFCAVLGILYITPLLSKCFHSRIGIINKMFDVLCISCAAQIATFPICVYYFGYFPNLFLLSNLVASVVIPFVIGGALLSLLFSWSSVLSSVFVVLTEKLSAFLFFFSKWISDLPYAVSDQLYFNEGEVICLFGVLLFFVLAIRFKSKALLMVCSSFVLLVCLQIVVNERKEDQFVVFDTYKETSFGALVDNRFYINTITSEKTNEYVIQPFLRKEGVDGTSIMSRETSFGQVNLVNGIRIYVVNKEVHDLSFECDFLLVSNNSVLDLEVLKDIRADCIIFDSSNDVLLCKKLTNQNLGFKVYFVPLDGAFIKELDDGLPI